MDKGARIYKDFIDTLVKMSAKCSDEGVIRGQRVRWNDENSAVINGLLEKLDDRERNALADFLLGTYRSAVHDVLAELEWMRCCKDMTITVEGEILPLGAYEGLHCDYIGRLQDWEWPDE